MAHYRPTGKASTQRVCPRLLKVNACHIRLSVCQAIWSFHVGNRGNKQTLFCHKQICKQKHPYFRLYNAKPYCLVGCISGWLWIIFVFLEILFIILIMKCNIIMRIWEYGKKHFQKHFDKIQSGPFSAICASIYPRNTQLKESATVFGYISLIHELHCQAKCICRACIFITLF